MNVSTIVRATVCLAATALFGCAASSDTTTDESAAGTATETASEAVAAGWAEPHPVALRGLIPPTAVMLYAPRDEAELDVIESLVRESHAFARPG